MEMILKRGISFVYLFRHFNLTPVRNLDCTSSLQPAPVLLHLPVCILSRDLGRHPVFLKMLNDANVASVRFFNGNI